MGFPARWCEIAMDFSSGDVDEVRRSSESKKERWREGQGERERERTSFRTRKDLKDCICLVKKFIVKGQRIFLV